jgi:1,4-dihydroxy-2-naphthoate octaprenyltransferase
VLRDLVLHLRLPFQLSLSAVFLWGVFVASGAFGPRTLLAWAAFTIGLSGGATAFNSFYDRDRGPVGGLRHPPPVTGALLPFSLAVMAAGLVAACFASIRIGTVYLAAAILFVAYSHPRIRTKRRPLLSLATVTLASGALTSLAGALSGEGGIPADAVSRVALGMLGASAVVAGFYPLTQLGQLDEDRARGDRTFAVAFGRDAAFRWAIPALGLGAVVNVGLAAAVLGWPAATGLALGLASLGSIVLRWRRDPSHDTTARSDLLAYGTAAVHAIVMLAKAFQGAGA